MGDQWVFAGSASTEAIVAEWDPDASKSSGADVIDVIDLIKVPQGLTDSSQVAADTFLSYLLSADDTYNPSVEQDLARLSSDIDQDISRIDDLDVVERFDLEATGRVRPSSRDGAGMGIVDMLDEIVDTLHLDDPEATAESAESAEREEEGEPDESEPDAATFARIGEAMGIEVDRSEELEKAIDHALNMEGTSIDDPVRIYLREIGRTPLLNATNESALAEKMIVGMKARADLVELLNQSITEQTTAAEMTEGGLDPASMQHLEEKRGELETLIRAGGRAKQQLVSANLRLVVSIARRYIGRGLSLLDLIQEGNIGLMKAADKFDYAKGFKFSTYATWWIRQAITRAISDQSRTIRLPVHVTEMVTRLRRGAHELQQTLLREPTEEELGQALNMPAERVRKILDMARHPASLDAPMEEGEDSFLGDFIEDEQTATPMEEASRQMLKEQVQDILDKLTDRERQILQMRYGLSDDKPRTLEEVAKEFGITRERIRQIETRILRKLRYARYGAGKLRGYLE